MYNIVKLCKIVLFTYLSLLLDTYKKVDNCLKFAIVLYYAYTMTKISNVNKKGCVKMKVLLHLADGFEEIEAISVIDILRRADINLQTVSVTEKKEVLGAHDIIVMADELFENADYTNAAMLILPGGSQGTEAMRQHTGLEKEILKAADEDKWIAAICAAPTILGKLGLLSRKSATCYPGLESDLKGADTSLQDSVIIDGKIITSRGPGTSFNFAFALVEVLKGKQAAKALKQKMIICD